MGLQERLSEDLKTAMKAGDKLRLNCVRMLVSRLRERQIALRGAHGAERVMTEQEAVDVVASYAKQRRESIEAFRNAGRADRAAEEEAELGILADYLPQQLGDDEVRAIVSRAIESTGATSPKDLGAVMKAIQPEVKGRADGKRVNELVRELLGGTSAAP